ncbi:MAG: L-seryl-tRNA(Sec) selenium transferase [Desulfobacterales bacterium]|jgi:L-seryl-tRNA(Ser) seleniumtransferase|nr:L-seryl-tRNA(Sec) selenium transferase [Desulfobacterales bacterium]
MPHLSKPQQEALRAIPGVDRMLELAQARISLSGAPKSIITSAIRESLETLRSAILMGKENSEAHGSEPLFEMSILQQVEQLVARAMTPNLRRVINATGVVVHTNLGRSLLAEAAIENLTQISKWYSNLEFDLETGNRGSRYSAVENLLCELTGAEAAMVVNNNAAAVLLCLNTLARGKHAIVSRGELVEIGGAFRIPDVMIKSGAILKEVGTTNRTHLRDYEAAITPETGLLLKVHASNFCVVGFTASVPLKDLVALGKKHHMPVMEDLGSGTLIDFSRYGLPHKEPTVQESVAAGADVITFSGDKLLGGPQAGIILGQKPMIAAIRQNSLTRALRIDKLTLAALESTLRLYRDEKKAVPGIPTLRMLTLSLETITARAHALAESLNAIADDRLSVQLLDLFSKVGGGALPLLNLPTVCIGISVHTLSARAIERFMRQFTPPIIGRIEADTVLLDPRTIQEDEAPLIEMAVRALLDKHPAGNRP